MTKKPCKIAGLVANGFQAEEFLEPKRACEAAGAHVDVISLQPGEIEAFNYFQRVGTLTVDKTIEQVHPEDYDAVLIPGGAYSPATLGGDDRVLAFLRQRSGTVARSIRRCSVGMTASPCAWACCISWR